MNRSTYRNRLSRRLTLIGVAAIATLSLLVTGAATAAAAPEIRVSVMKPDHVTPGKPMVIWVNVLNVGDEPFTGNMTLKYTFPAGLTVTDPIPDGAPAPTCTPAGAVNECVVDVTGVPLGRILNYQTLSEVDAGATGTLAGAIEVSGGGAGNSVTVPFSFSTDPIGPFDINSLDVEIADNPSLQPAQAGMTPPSIATAVEVLSQAQSNFDFLGFTVVSPPESFRDVIVHVPPGLVGYPTATPQRCTSAQLQEPAQAGSGQVPNCPRDSQIGLALVNGKDFTPLYNLVPPKGAPAMFAFSYQGLIVNLKPRVRSSDHGIDIVTSKAPSAVPIPKSRSGGSRATAPMTVCARNAPKASMERR
jgi:hypothetical protein